MAYAVKYVFTFQSVGGTTREIRILKDGYSGDPIRRALGRAPILKKQQNGPVHGTSLEMYAECHVDQEFIEFYTSDPKEYRVDLYAGNALLWQGWITPELYSEPDIAPPYDVQVIATDGVGELKLYDFAAQGVVSLRAMLTYLLGKTGLSTDVFLVSSLKAGGAGAGALLDMEANFDYLVGKTCYEALSYLLTTLHATITWWGGHWLLVRENNVTFTSGKVRYFNTAGNSALLANSVQELGSMYQDPAWPVGQLSTVIDPAKNKIVVQAPWHPVTALKNSDMTQDSDWGKILVTYDSTKGAYFFPRDVITAGELYQGVAFGGLRVPLRLAMSGCGTSETGSGFTGRGNGWLGLVLRYVDGSNNVYYLGTDGDGNRRWEQATPGQTPVRAFKQDLLSVDVDRENADRIELDIPALAVGGTFPAGTLTVSIFGGAAYLFSAQLDVILNKGYQDILHIDNGARGEGDDTEVAIGRVTSDIAYYQAFVQGILLNDGALITSFSDANFTTGMDFLSFISRDYARSVALPRARVEGTVSLEPSVQLPPLVFAKDGLNYWLETWSWNLYEDELQISARTLPTATLTVESETITEAGGTASTGSSSGGASSTPAVGLNYFEPNEDRASLIQLKPAYDYLGPRKGLVFGETAEADVEDSPAHLMLRNFGTAQNPKYALYTPFHLITGGDQIVLGGTPGGGSGGGSSYLWELLDVDDNLQSPAAGALLQYDSVAGLWKGNAPATQIGVGVTGFTTGALIRNVLGDDFNAQWSVKQFINSSIATATATFRGTNTTATTEAAFLTWANGLTHDLNDYVFWKTTDSLGNTVYKRYKYDGSQWVFEYELNNSSFTSEQWDSINSGITSGKVGTYDTIAGYFSGGKILSTALPAMYIGKTAVQFTSATQDLTGIGNVTLDNAKYLRAYNSAGDTLYNLAGLNASNYGYLGAANSPRTYMRGQVLYFLTGNSGNTSALTISNTQNATFYGSVYLQNAKQIYWKSTADTGGVSLGLLNFSASNTLLIGSGLIATGDNARAYNTYLYGGTISFYTGDSTNGSSRKWMINSSGTLYPYSNKSYNLGAAANYIKEAYIGKIFLASGIYMEYNSTDGYVYINAPLVTNGDQIVLSGTPGGGGGGGASYLYNLLDVDDALISPDNGVVLQYNATAGKWKGVASDTIGITAAGSVADLNAASPSTAKKVWSPAVLASWLSGKNYVELNPGNVEQTISSNINTLDKGVVNLWRKSGNHYTFLGFSNGTTETFLGGLGFKSQSDNNLYHWIKSGASSSYYKILDENNYSSVLGSVYAPAVTGGYLPLSGGTMSGDLTLANNKNINAIDTGSTARSLLYMSNSNNLVLGGGTKDITTGGNTYIDGKTIRLYTPNAQNTWTVSMLVNGNQNITIGASDLAAANYKLYVNGDTYINGAIVSTGDQIIASDERIKRNFKAIELSVDQIASCRAVSFDWAAGGHSFGSVAQDWEPLVPEAVKQGDIKTLAYGQLALVAAINIAKHDTERDKEIRKLKEKVKYLEEEVKRLRS